MLEGYNGKVLSYTLGTIFAYGQTGCGKTHTMMGVPDNEETQGIIPKAFMHIFGCIDGAPLGKLFLVRCSFLEIYNESILDLLTSKENQGQKLDVKEDKQCGVFVKGLTTVIVKNVKEIEKVLKAG